jgi:hypothetical protein
VEMSPGDEAKLVKRLNELVQGKGTAGRDDEMMTITRSVRMKRGSWWQLPKDFKERPEDD